MFVENEVSQGRDADMSSLSRLVEQTANKIFNLTIPQLTAVVTKVSGMPDELMEDGIFAFLRSAGPDGGSTYVAVNVEPHMIKHHVACADILEEERFNYA